MIFINNYIEECKYVLNNINQDSIISCVDILYNTKINNGRLFIIGSGGGAGNASHAVCDFRKICKIESYAPYDNISELTARTNDDGWENTLSNYFENSNLKKYDTILVFSVGGGDEQKKISVNLINAIKFAKKFNCKIIGIQSKKDSYLKNNSDSLIEIPIINSELTTPITEGYQTLIWHLIVSHPLLKINKTIW